MTRPLATVTDHARRAITALLEHVDAAWDCWEAPEETQEGALGLRRGEVDSGGSTERISGRESGDYEETR